MEKTAIALISGGVNSSTILAFARKVNYKIYGITLIHEGVSEHERVAASKLADRYGCVEYVQMDVSGFGKNIPAKNSLFLAYAQSYAERVHATRLLVGSSMENKNGDHRQEFFRFVEIAFNSAYRTDGNTLALLAPLTGLDRPDTIRWGQLMGADYKGTTECVNTLEIPCGFCPGCADLRVAFNRAGIPDPNTYSTTGLLS